MAKMNLDFLLSPDSASASGNRGSGSRSSRAESSPFSLEYIAPRHSPDDRHRSSRQRRAVEPLLNSRSHPSSSSKPPPPKDQGQTSSRSHHYIAKKGKAPSSPSALRTQPSVEVKPHVCRACDRSFYKLEQLKRHDRLVHLNLRPFLCTTCDLSFGTKQNMQVHLTTRKHKHRLETLQSNSAHGASTRHHR